MRVRRAAVAVAAALLLTSCAGPGPGVAATVEGTEITDDQVDDFALVLCSIGVVAEGEPTAQARLRALQILLANELATHVADVDAVDQAAVSSAEQQAAADRETVPESLRDTYDELVREFARAQTAILELGRESLSSSGQPGEITDEAAFAEGERIRAEYAASADIEVDPRFGSVEEGALQPPSGSLSVPASDFAVGMQAEQPSADAVAELPASQKCG